jgi:hypothetical protein
MTVPVGRRFPHVDEVSVGDVVTYRPSDYPITDEYQVEITAAETDRGGVVTAITTKRA